MERTVVIYKSKNGSTEKYANWIGEELECPVFKAEDFSKKDFEDYLSGFPCQCQSKHTDT